jgi:two-component system nitrate/nitrite response regulator NarL
LDFETEPKGSLLQESTIRVLVVDDYAPWREAICSILQRRNSFQVVGEATDGFKAVQKAQDLQPDLILLDLGLPSINGIEAARQIRVQCPNSKILIVTENRSPDMVEAALNAGALGYVVKANAAHDLIPAAELVLQGKQFVSADCLPGKPK